MNIFQLGPTLSSSSSASYNIINSNFHGIDTTLLLFAWFLLLISLKILFEYGKDRNYKLVKYLPESCIYIMVGLFIGLLLNETGLKETHFGGLFAELQQEQLGGHKFFIFVLPPIIFEAAYVLNRHSLFLNFFEITLFAFVGTICNRNDLKNIFF